MSRRASLAAPRRAVELVGTLGPAAAQVVVRPRSLDLAVRRAVELGGLPRWAAAFLADNDGLVTEAARVPFAEAIGSLEPPPLPADAPAGFDEVPKVRAGNLWCASVERRATRRSLFWRAEDPRLGIDVRLISSFVPVARIARPRLPGETIEALVRLAISMATADLGVHHELVRSGITSGAQVEAVGRGDRWWVLHGPAGPVEVERAVAGWLRDTLGGELRPFVLSGPLTGSSGVAAWRSGPVLATTAQLHDVVRSAIEGLCGDRSDLVVQAVGSSYRLTEPEAIQMGGFVIEAGGGVPFPCPSHDLPTLLAPFGSEVPADLVMFLVGLRRARALLATSPGGVPRSWCRVNAHLDIDEARP